MGDRSLIREMDAIEIERERDNAYSRVRRALDEAIAELDLVTRPVDEYDRHRAFRSN